MKNGEPSTRTDGWVETEATIICCKRTLLSSVRGSGITSDPPFELPEYAVRFQYVVGSRIFTGRYVARSEQSVGSTLTIAYDPKKPSRNTCSNLIRNPWIWTGALAIAAGMAALAAWLGFDDVPPF